MRNLVVAVLCFFSFEITMAAELRSSFLSLLQSSELVSNDIKISTNHLLVLGALKKVDHELQPEKSIIVSAEINTSTWYIPEIRTTQKVMNHFRSELGESASVLFECEGRACGSSSYWANKHFEKAVMYGPEQYQRYLIVKPAAESHAAPPDYIIIYVAKRATRKIYVHIEEVFQS